MGCCESAPKVPLLIQSKLNDLYKVFPGTSFAVVLKPNGEPIACTTPASLHETKSSNNALADMKGNEEIFTTIATFRKTASSFGAALQQSDCSVVHIRGNSNLFSCYNIDHAHVLAFYCDVQSLNLDVFDLSSADSSMLPLLDELRQLIVLLYQPKT